MVRFLASADRHGVDREDAEHAATRPVTVVLLREEPGKELRLGFDRIGRPLEVVVVTIRGREHLIHAMPLRRRYLDLLEGRP